MSAERADRPYVDTPVRPDDDADGVAARAADQWGLPRPEPMRRGMNALYRCGDAIIRVGRPSAPADAALDLLAALQAQGVPVLRPLVDHAIVDGELVATAWPFVEHDPERRDWHEIGRIVRLVHRVDADALPADYPVPHPRSFPWWDFDALFDDLDDGEIDAVALDGLTAAIARQAGWASLGAGSEVVCHGDVHPGNVLATADGSMLIDWDLMCWAPPGWDHAMLCSYASRWGGSPDALTAFERGYGASLRDDPVTTAVAELRNVAATLMRVKAGRHDEAARAEAERRLRFWRGDADAPVWRAQ